MKEVVVLILILYGIATAQSTRLSQSCGVRYSSRNYGRDYSDTRDVQIQVGECYAQYSPINTTGSEIIEVNSSCQPRCIAKRQNHMDLLLLTTVEPTKSVEECQSSMDHCSNCRNTPSYQTFYADQPSYIKTVDLGSCKGMCSDTNTSCIPTATYNIALRGPNGFRIETRTSKCGCASPKCNRQRYFLEVAPANSSTTKIVDIGRCIGACLGETVPICIPLGSNPCAYEFRQPANLCAPTMTQKKYGVDIIKTCGCRRT